MPRLAPLLLLLFCPPIFKSGGSPTRLISYCLASGPVPEGSPSLPANCHTCESRYLGSFPIFSDIFYFPSQRILQRSFRPSETSGEICPQIPTPENLPIVISSEAMHSIAKSRNLASLFPTLPFTHLFSSVLPRLTSIGCVVWLLMEKTLKF
jgi:hypothetical protein